MAKRPMLPRRLENGRTVIPFNRDEMERICADLASGKSLATVMKNGRWSISIATVYRWMVDYPEARDMMFQARLLRSFAWEDQSMQDVEDLREGRVEKEQIRARDVALHHTRWLMGKWNAQDFGEHKNPKPTIAIQINTNALGEGEEFTDPRVMTIEATVVEESGNGRESGAGAPVRIEQGHGGHAANR